MPPHARKDAGPTVVSADLGPLLDGWDHEPGALNVRKVVGQDGEPKLQVRLDMGVLQMETHGRPDGRTIGPAPTVLHKGRARRRRFGQLHPAGRYVISPIACELLREEAAMFQQRCLAFFVLEEHEPAARDAAHILRIDDFLQQHARRLGDRQSLRPFRPQLLMLHGRSLATVQLAGGDFAAALDTLNRSLNRLRRHFGPDVAARRRSVERQVLARMRRDVIKQLPPDEPTAMRRELAAAIEREDYERAAELRDALGQVAGR